MGESKYMNKKIPHTKFAQSPSTICVTKIGTKDKTNYYIGFRKSQNIPCFKNSTSIFNTSHNFLYITYICEIRSLMYFKCISDIQIYKYLKARGSCHYDGCIQTAVSIRNTGITGATILQLFKDKTNCCLAKNRQLSKKTILD